MADTSNKASLGCGTLILIALIVLFFSGGNKGNPNREIRELQQEVRALANRPALAGVGTGELKEEIVKLRISVDTLQQAVSAQQREISALTLEVQTLKPKTDRLPPVEGE